MSQPLLLIPFKKADQYPTSLVGEMGKAKQKISQAKLPTSDGFIISSQVFFELITPQIAHQLQAVLSLIDIHDPASVKQAGNQFRRVIQKIPLSQDLAASIAQTYDQFPSSSVFQIQGVFAHQTHPTLSAIYSTGEANLLIDIKKMWSELFQDSVLVTALQQKQGFSQLKPVILVDVSLPPRMSGVLSTMNPHNGNKRTIKIEAVWGFPEYLSTHPGEKDEYEVEKDSWEVINHSIQTQEKEVTFQHGKLVQEKIPASRKKLAKLSDNQLLMLAHVVKKIQAAYFFPQECFWQIDKKNELSITFIQPLTESNLSQSLGSQLSQPLAYGVGAVAGKQTGKARVFKQWTSTIQLDPTDILVIKNLKPSEVSQLPPIAGLVCDTALLPKDLAKLRIPAVTNTKIASSVIRDGQFITVIGDMGIVLDGAIEPTTTHLPSNKYQLPNLNWWYRLEHLNHVAPNLVQQAVGIGPVRGKDVLQLLGIHPQVLIQRNKLGVFEEALYQTLHTLLVISENKPVLYELLDMTSQEYRSLTGGDNIESPEPNALLGYHGAYRIIFERELLHLQLRVIDQLHQRFDHLQVVVPFVRTIEEWAVLLKSFRLLESVPVVWASIHTPAMAMALHQLKHHGVQGCVLKEKDFFSLFTGSQLDQPHEFLPQLANNDGYFAFIKIMTDTCRVLQLPFVYDGELNTQQVIQRLKQNGVSDLTFTESQQNVLEFIT